MEHMVVGAMVGRLLGLKSGERMEVGLARYGGGSSWDDGFIARVYGLVKDTEPSMVVERSGTCGSSLLEH